VERRSEAGGRMRTDMVEGVAFDSGVQLLGSNYTSTFSLAAAAGLSELVVRSPGRDAVWRRGNAHPLTYGSVASMITSSALPAGLKLRLGTRYLPYLSRHARLDLHDLVRTGGLELDGESIAAWGGRELNRDFVELLAYPLMGAYYGSLPEETSSAVYHALARVGLDVSVYGVRGGMGMLPRRIAAELERRGVLFRYDRAVSSVEIQDSRAVVTHDAGTETGSSVVLAVTARESARLATFAPRAVEWLAGVRAHRTVTVALVLSRPLGVDYFGLSLPRSEPSTSDVVAICVQERKVDGLVPAGRGALVLLAAPAESDTLAELAPDALLARLIPVVDRVFPGIRQAVQRGRATYFEEGSTIFYPGYVTHLSRFDAAWLPGNVALAGDYLAAPNVEGAVRSGVQAAARIMGGSAQARPG